VRWNLRILLLIAAVACGSAEDRAEDARERVRDALARGDRRAAIESIDDLRAALPESPEALVEVAQLQVQSGSAPDAGWLLEEAVRRYPENDELRLTLGRVALLLGNPALAREAVLPVASESEQHPGALVVRAQAELNLGSLDQALETLAEAEKLYPDRPEARLVRISTLLQDKRRDEALAAIAEARAAQLGDDEESEAIRRRLDLTLAQIEAAQGEADAALRTLDTMIEANPADLHAWRLLAQVLMREERSEEALARIDAALAEDEAAVGLNALAAEVHAARGDPDEAVAALNRFVARSDSAAAYLPLVSYHSVREDAEATADVLTEAVSRYPEEPTLRLLYAETLLAQGKLDAARAQMDRFRDLTFEGDPQVDYLIARVELAEGDADTAARRLRALAPKLDRASTQFWLGRALEELGDNEGARRRYGLAMQRDPQWVAPVAALLSLEQRRGDWRAVLSRAQVVVARTPLRIEGWVAMIEALESLGEGEAAEKAARQCIELFPDRPEPSILLARALRALGRTDDALAALAEAEAGGGDRVSIATERVLTLGIGGRIDEGVGVARQALAADPEAPRLHAALASLLFAAGAAEEGARATDRALALDPEQPRPWRVRCEFRAATGRWAGAIEDCRRYLAVRPDDAGAHFILGVALQHTGDVQAARDARPRNNLAELLASHGDLDGALAVAQEAYRLDETDPYVMDTLGALYLRKGLADRALSLLEEAHTKAPELPEATLHLAMAYRDTGRTDEARALLVALDADDDTKPQVRAQAREALDSLP
jgi:tetratricopeptide (TPR) repeat protein